MRTKQINYSLRESSIRKQDGTLSFFPKVHYSDKVDTNEFVEMATKGKEISPEVFMSCMNMFVNTTGEIIGNGGILSTRWIRAMAVMKGGLDNKDEFFSPEENENHRIMEHIYFATEKRRDIFATNNVKFSKEKYFAKIPQIYSVHQHFPFVENTIERGSSGVIQGQNLIVDPRDENTGVFVKDAQGTKTFFKTSYSSNGNKVSFKVPADLEAGDYQLNFAIRKDDKNHDFPTDKRITIK